MRGPNQSRIVLLLAVVAALLSAVTHLRWAQSLKVTRGVITVTSEIPAFAQVTGQNLRQQQLPPEAIPSDAITAASEVEGQYTRTLLLPGTVLRKQHLMPREGGSLAARLTDSAAPTARAMALQVNADTGVAGTLEPGDRVDVLVSIRIEGQEPVSYAKVIARGIRVLHTGKENGTTVVLEVPTQLAEDIAFAHTSGSIWLLTRPYQVEDGETSGATLTAFLEKYGLRSQPNLAAGTGGRISVPSGQTLTAADLARALGGGR